jgi:hypothetical protein
MAAPVAGPSELNMSPVTAALPPDAHVVLSPEGTFFSENAPPAEALNDRHRQLVIAIRQRIESRLAGRIRDLAVRFDGETVVLEGKCATYYSKQLAQHTALAILEHEQLENAIVVAVPR